MSTPAENLATAEAAAADSTRFSVSYSQVWVLAYPIMLGALAQNLINVTNTAFLSRVGEVEVGASVIGGILYFVLVFMGSALATGTQILVARRTGEGRDKEVGKIVDHSFYVMLGVSVLFFLLLKFVAPPVFRAILTSQAVAETCIVYIDIRAFEIFSGMIFWTYRGFFTAIGRTYAIIIATASLAAVNILLDYTLIFGNFGFPVMGIRGAAYASLTAEWVAVLVYTGIVLVQGLHRKYGMFRWPKLDVEQLKQMLNLSLPLVLQNLISMGAWLFFFLAIEKRGETELAAANLVRSLYMLFMIPAWGFGAATNALVSNVIGQGKHNRIGLAIRLCVQMAIVVTTALSIWLLLFPRWLLTNLYDAKPEMITLTQPWIWIVFVASILCSVAIVFLYATTGTGATRFTMQLEFVLIATYLAFIWVTAFVLQTSTTIVWLCEILYWAMMIAACAWYLQTGRWRALKL